MGIRKRKGLKVSSSVLDAFPIFNRVITSPAGDSYSRHLLRQAVMTSRSTKCSNSIREQVCCCGNIDYNAVLF
jgi:hypothetical protein